MAAHWLAKSLRNTPLGTQAVADDSKSIAYFLSQFSACLDMTLDTTVAPNITAYLSYVTTKLRAESRRLKNSVFRRRPYAQLGETTLIPDDEEEESTDSSYPSTHSNLGWGLSLAMVELTPDSMNGKFNYATIDVSGNCTVTPTDTWTSADKVTLKLVFSFQATNNSTANNQ